MYIQNHLEISRKKGVSDYCLSRDMSHLTWCIWQSLRWELFNISRILTVYPTAARFLNVVMTFTLRVWISVGDGEPAKRAW